MINPNSTRIFLWLTHHVPMVRGAGPWSWTRAPSHPLWRHPPGSPSRRRRRAQCVPPRRWTTPDIAGSGKIMENPETTMAPNSLKTWGTTKSMSEQKSWNYLWTIGTLKTCLRCLSHWMKAGWSAMKCHEVPCAWTHMGFSREMMKWMMKMMNKLRLTKGKWWNMMNQDEPGWNITIIL